MTDKLDTAATPVHAAMCYDCGTPYGGPRFPDLVVPHEVWAKISPTGDEGGLLCPSCMCAAAEAVGVKCKATFRSGPFFEADPRAVERLVEAARAALNYLENTEGEFGITLESATDIRAALAATETGHD